MPSVLHRHGSPMIPSSWGPANLTWFSSLHSRVPRTAQRPGLSCHCAALTVRATDDHRLWPRPHGEQGSQGSSHATGLQGPPTLGTSFPGGCPRPWPGRSWESTAESEVESSDVGSPCFELLQHRGQHGRGECLWGAGGS